jgi:hypothetical protein
MDPDLIFEFEVNGYDNESDWVCDLGDVHPYITYEEQNGDPCPWWLGIEFIGTEDD